MIAVDLLAFAQTLLLHDSGLARVEPKALRYRLLHVAARITRRQRRLWLHIDRRRPWTRQLAAAFDWAHDPADTDRLTSPSRPTETSELPAERHAGQAATPNQNPHQTEDQ
jgi:hypothetical protein